MVAYCTVLINWGSRPRPDFPFLSSYRCDLRHDILACVASTQWKQPLLSTKTRTCVVKCTSFLLATISYCHVVRLVCQNRHLISNANTNLACWTICRKKELCCVSSSSHRPPWLVRHSICEAITAGVFALHNRVLEHSCVTGLRCSGL